MEFIFIVLSWMILLVPGFDDSVPSTGDKIFKIETSPEIVQSITIQSDEPFDFSGLDIQLKQNSTGTLDLKIPKNLPHPASYIGFWAYDERPIILSDGFEIGYDVVEDPCYSHYRIPIDGNTNLEILYAVILTGSWQLYSPIQFDENNSCYNEVFYKKLLSPLKQFKSGISIEEIKCKESLVLVTKYDGSPACVKPETIPKLIERGWIDSIEYYNRQCENSPWVCSQHPEDLIDNNTSKHDDANLQSGKFYAQPQLTSAIIKKDSTVRVHLFSYAVTEYSDGDWVQDFDEMPKNSKIGIVEKSADNAKTFASSGHEILPNGITAELLLEEGYYVVYLTADSDSEAGKYELSIVSIDESGSVIEKPLYLTIVEQPSTKSPQEKILRVVSKANSSWIDFDNISEQEYWKIQESRKPWPPVPILDITDNNIHPTVRKLIDVMWDQIGKYHPYEYDKNILVKDTRITSLESDHRAISDWLKKIHDEQFKRNLDDSSTNYIKYQDKIYTFGGGIVD
jgi:hypothetical protein